MPKGHSPQRRLGTYVLPRRPLARPVTGSAARARATTLNLRTATARLEDGIQCLRDRLCRLTLDREQDRQASSFAAQIVGQLKSDHAGAFEEVRY